MASKDSELTWRTRDFSHIQESYSFAKPGNNIPATILYMILTLPVFPLSLILILVISSRKIRQTIFPRLFTGFHLIIAIMFACVGSFTLRDPDAWVGFALNMLLAVYFLLLRSISFKAMKVSLDKHPKLADDDMVPFYLQQHKVFGDAGDLSSAKGRFSDANIEAGEKGEKLTAVMLEDLLRIPGTRIIHGLKWPGTKNADIDHIAVNGNKIAVIDSKMWAGTNHIFTSSGDVVSYNGKGEKTHRKIHFDKAVAKLAKDMRRNDIKGAKYKGWVAIHSGTWKKAKTSNKHNPNSVIKLSAAKDAVEEIGEWFAQDVDGVINFPVVEDLLNRLKK